MYGISIKICQYGKIVKKTIYLVIGLIQDGLKKVLGISDCYCSKCSILDVF